MTSPKGDLLRRSASSETTLASRKLTTSAVRGRCPGSARPGLFPSSMMVRRERKDQRIPASSVVHASVRLTNAEFQPCLKRAPLLTDRPINDGTLEDGSTICAGQLLTATKQLPIWHVPVTAARGTDAVARL